MSTSPSKLAIYHGKRPGKYSEAPYSGKQSVGNYQGKYSEAPFNGKYSEAPYKYSEDSYIAGNYSEVQSTPLELRQQTSHTDSWQEKSKNVQSNIRSHPNSRLGAQEVLALVKVLSKILVLLLTYRGQIAFST